MSTPIHVLRLVALEERPPRLLVRPESPCATPHDPYHADRLTNLAIRAMEVLLAPLPKEERSDLGMVIGTLAGCLEVDRAFDRSRREHARFASPAAFSRTLPSTVPAELSLHFGLTGPSLTVSDAAAPFALAAYRAARWLEAFDLPGCICGIVDHLPGGFENPRTGRPIADPEGVCLVQFWFLSRQTSGDALGTFTVSPRPSYSSGPDTSGNAHDLDAEWLLAPRGDYWSPQLHFKLHGRADDR